MNEVNTIKDLRPTTKITTVSEVSSSKGASKSTAILMPTIVGKSVKGAAMQAVAMSRARARASTSRPSNVTTVAKPNTGNPPPKVVRTSSWKTRNDKPNTRAEKQDNIEIMKYLPPSLAKEYMGAHNIIAKYSVPGFAASNILQKVFISWLPKFKGKQIHTFAMEFITLHANFVNVQTFQLMQSMFDDPCPFLTYLSKVLISQFNSTTILSKNFSWMHKERLKQNVMHPTVYIMRKIALSENQVMLLIYKISVFSTKEHGKFGQIKCWSFLNSQSKALAKKDTALASLDAKFDLFNFALSLLRGIIKNHSQHYTHNISIPSLLRETKAIFPTRVQRR